MSISVKLEVVRVVLKSNRQSLFMKIKKNWHTLRIFQTKVPFVWLFMGLGLGWDLGLGLNLGLELGLGLGLDLGLEFRVGFRVRVSVGDL